MKVETTKFKVIMDWSPSTRLSEVLILFLDEEEQDEWLGCYELSLDNKKYFWFFDALTLDLRFVLLRSERLEVLLALEVISEMMLLAG